MTEVNWKLEVRNLSEQGLFEVQSERHPGQYYVVDLEVKSCTCGDHKFRGRICKHLCAVLNTLPEKHIVTETCNSFQEQAPILKDWFDIC